MQGAKTLKCMLPFGRREQSHKSVSFKTVFKQFLKNHEKYAKTDSNMVESPNENHQTNDTEKHGEVLPQKNVQIGVSILEPFARGV